VSYSEDNPRFGVAKMLLFLVPAITLDSWDNSSFKSRALEYTAENNNTTVMWWHGVAVNMLVVLNKVTLRQARLVLGWVTICRWVNHLGM